MLTSLKTTSPNNFDAVKAVITQVSSLFYRPNLVLLNPIDFASMELTKDTDGQYVLPPFSTSNGKIVSGVSVAECPAIPEGYVLGGDFKKVKIRNYKPFTVSVGWVNDDFEKNLVTMIGEQRMHLFIAHNDTAGLCYDSLANIKTAITQI